MVCEGLPVETYTFYALGSLADDEATELRSHLDRDCARCKSELAKARTIWYGVALSAPDAKPKSALRKRVIASVQHPAAFRLAWWQPVAGLAAFALAVFAGFQLGSSRREPAAMVRALPAPVADSAILSRLEIENRALRDRLASVAKPVPTAQPNVLSREKTLPQDNATFAALASARQELARRQDLLVQAQRDAAEANRKLSALGSAQPKPDVSEQQRQLAAAQTRTQQLEQDLAQYKSLLAGVRQRLQSPPQSAALLADPNLKLVRLRGTVSGSDMEGHVLLASGSQAIFYGSQLPALPPGRAYQLWLIRASAPAIVSAGVFQPDAQRRATVRFDGGTLTTGVTVFAVTDEPEAGSALPTGHKLLIGS